MTAFDMGLVEASDIIQYQSSWRHGVTCALISEKLCRPYRGNKVMIAQQYYTFSLILSELMTNGLVY